MNPDSTISRIRLEKAPKRLVTEHRYLFIQARIGYLCRAGAQIQTATWRLSDTACRDGALLRMPPRSFSDVYYSDMQPNIRNDSDIERTAIYFDPYSGRFIVVGSKQLYEDARKEVGTAGTPLFIEDESPMKFDAASYGEFRDPDGLILSYNDYFTQDALGKTVIDCMVKRVWNGKTGAHACALSFFDRYCDKLLAFADTAEPDLLTSLLASVVKEGNAALLGRLLAMIPQYLSRFRLNLREEAKFAGNQALPPITLPETEGETPPPLLFNLFQYTLLCGDADTVQTLFAMFDRPMELHEFLHHPMYGHIGFYLIRTHNTAALSVLIGAGFSPDCTDPTCGRLTLSAQACLSDCPAAAALLVRAGADFLRKDNRGKNAFDYAIECKTPACFAELLNGLSGTDTASVPVLLSAKITLDEESQMIACLLSNYIRAHN